ncbi:hypothetical protein [Cohnella sp. 56]|uniref:hypothetical protein n=1 Tax=Cohnella sp. 56 TaxID=3113722 RepID=UPI0030E98FBE
MQQDDLGQGSAVKQNRLSQPMLDLLSSIAREEMALAHIVHAEAEKIRYALGDPDSPVRLKESPSIHQWLELGESVRWTMDEIVIHETLLLQKLRKALRVRLD